MKKRILLFALLLIFISNAFGQDVEPNENPHGLLIMGGGRYDDLRMCVGSAAGVKGGPVADIMYLHTRPFGDDRNLTLNLPVMRPILFSLAFEMLQFEPEITFEHKRTFGNIELVTGPGIGVSLHYGPDYQSDLDDRGDSFFALGPFFSYKAVIPVTKDGSFKKLAGLKAFYTPLFSQDRSVGTVLGISFIYTLHF